MIEVPTEGGPAYGLVSGDDLLGVDGNAFAVMAETKRLLLIAGASKEFIAAYVAEATSGNYDHLLATSLAYLDSNS